MIEPTNSSAPQAGPNPNSAREDDLRALEQLFGTPVEGAALGLFVDAGDNAEMRCVLPGCPDPHVQAGDVRPDVSLWGGNQETFALPMQREMFLSDRAAKGLPWAVANATWRGLRVAWHFVRQVSGDDAYERYLAHMRRAHPAQPAMVRSDYYRFRLEQKWNRITRCC